MSEKTRAGLLPAMQNEVPYEITTAEAEEYLNKVLSALISKLRTTEDGRNTPDVDVMLCTSSCGKKFAPFFAILPINVLAGKKNKNEKEPDIFNPDVSDDYVQVKRPFFNFFQPFMYNKSDVNAWESNEWRRNMEVTRNSVITLRNNRTFRVNKFNGGKNEYVTFLIDPVRLFHEMLVNPEKADKEKFNVYITNIEQIKQGSYKYSLVKSTSKKNKPSKSLEEKITLEVAGRLGR